MYEHPTSPVHLMHMKHLMHFVHLMNLIHFVPLKNVDRTLPCPWMSLLLIVKGGKAIICWVAAFSNFIKMQQNHAFDANYFQT